MFNLNDPRVIGMGLSGIGVMFSFLGILLFLDKGARPQRALIVSESAFQRCYRTAMQPRRKV